MEILCRKSPLILLFTLANALQIQVCPFKDYYPILLVCCVLFCFFKIFAAIYINKYESNYKITASYLLPLYLNRVFRKASVAKQ